MNPAHAIANQLALMGIPHLVWKRRKGTTDGPRHEVFIFNAADQRLCVLIAEPDNGTASDPFYYFTEKWAAQGALIRIINTERQLAAAISHIERLERIARSYPKPPR
jgi:hypothetical protein